MSILFDVLSSSRAGFNTSKTACFYFAVTGLLVGIVNGMVQSIVSRSFSNCLICNQEFGHTWKYIGCSQYIEFSDYPPKERSYEVET